MALYDSVALPAQAAAAGDVTTVVGTVEVTDSSGSGVQRVVITPPPGYTTVTGVATNNATFNFRQVRGGAVQATFASVTLNAGTNLVAETPLNVPISSSPNFAPDDVIDVVMHQNGTGIAIGAGLLVEVNLA